MDDTDDLVERLLAIAGGLMEDASAVAILRDGPSLEQRVGLIQQGAQDVAALAEAMEVIHRGRLLAGIGQESARGSPTERG